jgi:tetratricopeptide (TPR) repeat protein
MGAAPGSGRDDADLRLEQARFFWWAAELERADSIVGIVLALRPGDLAADSLRSQIRMAAEPDVALAARWLESRPGALEHLLLGRALTRAGRAGEAVSSYRAALRLGVHSDSVALEAASIAAGADSLLAAADALELYLQSRPQDSDVRIRLARVFEWTERTDHARREYGILLRHGGDPAIRFELAQLEFRAERFEAAAIELRRVLAVEPGHPAALTLMGDIARLRGDGEGAIAYADAARRAAPASTASGDLRGSDAPAPAAGRRPASASGWQVDIDAFGDSEGFRWLGTRGAYLLGDARRYLGVAVERNDFEGADGMGTPQPGSGLGAELSASLNVGAAMTVSGRVGGRSLDGDFRLPTWGAEARLTPEPRRSAALGYQRQPAVRRASTLAALHAEARSDLLQLTATSPVPGGDLWSRVEVERFSSELGSTGRIAGTVAASTTLSSSWIGSAVLSGLAADGASPVLSGWGPLYWSPELYASAVVGLAYASMISDRLWLTARAAPGYVWVRERDGTDRRFGDEQLPVLGLSAEAAYSIGRWRLGAGGDWNGALLAGYRAAALRLQISQPIGDR